MLQMAISRHLQFSNFNSSRLVSSIRLLGKLDSDGPAIFKPETNLRAIPAVCHLKDIADTVIQPKEANIATYEDMSKSTTPYILCCVPDCKGLPLQVNEEEFKIQLDSYRRPDKKGRTTKPNQHATWGAYITNFHRDTMFSTKVHTLSPGSIKLWCFERTIGQMDLALKNDSESEMKQVLSDPEGYDFYIQEPWQVVEHKGAYAHFVITFNHVKSRHGQWSALVGWEVNSASQIHHSMRVDTPLLQGKNGLLRKVTPNQFLSACATTVKISVGLLREQKEAHANFLDGQQEKSTNQAASVKRAREKKQSRFSGLKRGPSPSEGANVKGPSFDIPLDKSH